MKSHPADQGLIGQDDEVGVAADLFVVVGSDEFSLLGKFQHAADDRCRRSFV
jgi:hypothetical protein